jgi:hypothetical protein
VHAVSYFACSVNVTACTVHMVSMIPHASCMRCHWYHMHHACGVNDTACTCCGSNSERVWMFWLYLNPDLNSKKKFGFRYGFGSRHCCRMKMFVKNQRSNTLCSKEILFSWITFLGAFCHKGKFIFFISA